jgi:tetratricopeptide (TPR) repeat protein
MEFYFFKLNPLAYHTTNLLLHLINSLLVFWLIRWLKGSLFTSWVVALLFSIHPLHVESVAWVSQRKDLLYSFFFLGSWISYLHYRKTKSNRDYLLSLALFVLSLLSKGMAITLPIVLLLSDYLLHRTFDKRSLVEKIPFLLLGFLFGIIGLFAQVRAETGSPGSSPLFEQLLTISFVLTSFLSKLILPIRLSCYHPYFKPAELSWGYILLYPSLIVSLSFLGILFSRWSRKIPFGLLFFLITLLPVLPLKIIAERYTYLPYIGIFYIIGEGLSGLLRWRFPFTKIARIFILILFTGTIAALAILSHQRCQVWKDSLTLWNDVLKKYPNSQPAYHHRGTAYLNMGEYERAISDYHQALRVNPGHPQTYSVYHNLGAAYHNQKEFDRAISHYSQSIEKKPDYFLAYHHRGLAYIEKGEYDRAIADFNKVIEINPRFAEAYYNRGNAYLKQNLTDHAISDYTKAIEINPKFYLAYYNRGNAYVTIGLHDHAISDFNKAIGIYPGYSEAFTNRGVAYLAKGLYEQALSDFTKAIEINPKGAIAYYNRGYILSRKGLYDQAISDFHQALSINRRYSEAYIQKALLCEKVGEFKEAIEAYRGFIQTAPPQYAKQIQFARNRIKELSLPGFEKFRR